MIDFALDPFTGDLIFQDFDFSLVENIDQIAQNLAIRLRFMYGEWYLNVFIGVPYYEFFFIKNPNQIQIETFLKNEIMDTPGVIEITNFASDFDGFTRRFTVRFGCRVENETLQLELDIP